MRELRVLGEAETPPFEIVENSTVKEELRLKYRYLDLRRPDMQRALLARHRIVKCARDYFDDNGFVEIETPMLVKSTPEARAITLCRAACIRASFSRCRSPRSSTSSF